MTWFVGMDQQFPKTNVILEPILWPSSLSKESNGKLSDAEDYIYWAFSTETPESTPRTPQELHNYVAEHTKDWDRELTVLFDYANWSLAVGTRIYSSKPDIGDFSNGRGLVSMIGDSAHPMTPQGGLGGSTAVQAAADLCRTLENEGLNRESFAAFEIRMRALARRSIESCFNMAKFMIAGKNWQEFAEVDR